MTFEEYVAARGPALLRYAYLLAGQAEDAEDLVQTALATASRGWGRIGALAHPDAYVRRVVTTSFIDGRRRRRSGELPVDVAALPERATADPASSQAERDAMWRLLADLPPRQRAVLVLRFYEDLDDGAIADVLDTTPSTVRSNAARALAALRQRLPAHPSLEEQQ